MVFSMNSFGNSTRIATLYLTSIWCALLCVGSYFYSQRETVGEGTSEFLFFDSMTKSTQEQCAFNRSLFRPRLNIKDNGAKLYVLSKFQRGCADHSADCSMNGNRQPLTEPLSLKCSAPSGRAGQFHESSGTRHNICSEVLRSTDNVFFLETSCAYNQSKRLPGDLTLSEKQACSIYSAAVHNPNKKIILLLTCPIASNWSNEPLEILLDLPNFFYGWLILDDFFANTSLLEFYRVQLAKSSFYKEQTADVLRLYILYRYGGTYIDLDVITLKSFDDLGVNYVGLENQIYTANGIMNFEPDHELLKRYLIKTLIYFHPQTFNSIGPILLTNLLRSWSHIMLRLGGLASNRHLRELPNICSCIQEDFGMEAPTYIPSCNLTLMPPRTFYPIKWQDWEDYYNSTRWPEIQKLVNGSHAVHYWNHMGSPELGNRTDDVPIIKLAEQHCPPLPLGPGKLK